MKIGAMAVFFPAIPPFKAAPYGRREGGSGVSGVLRGSQYQEQGFRSQKSVGNDDDPLFGFC